MKTTLKNLTLGAIIIAMGGMGAACGQQTNLAADLSRPADLRRGADMSERQDLTAPVPDLLVSRMTTIADARKNLVTGAITVSAVVTGIHSTQMWYIEDLAGGPYSGVAVYCNKGATSNACPAGVKSPALHDLITITGTLTTFENQVQLLPLSLATVLTDVPSPPAQAALPADLDPNGNSPLRGVRVQISVPLTVDNVTPAKLYDTACAKGDAGAMALCKGCKPPTYAGFQVNDGSGHELLIEESFYLTENLANSPECLTQPGAVPVHVGQVFTMVTGIFDVDTYDGVQVLSPVTDGDYTLMP